VRSAGTLGQVCVDQSAPAGAAPMTTTDMPKLRRLVWQRRGHRRIDHSLCQAMWMALPRAGSPARWRPHRPPGLAEATPGPHGRRPGPTRLPAAMGPGISRVRQSCSCGQAARRCCGSGHAWRCIWPGSPRRVATACRRTARSSDRGQRRLRDIEPVSALYSSRSPLLRYHSFRAELPGVPVGVRLTERRRGRCCVCRMAACFSERGPGLQMAVASSMNAAATRSPRGASSPSS
jgi:hypothetical protein